MFGISKGTILRTGVLLLALVNTTLQLFGVEVLPFTEDELELGLTAVLNVVAGLVAWWKNNSFTEEGQRADAVLEGLKTEKKAKNKRKEGVK